MGRRIVTSQLQSTRLDDAERKQSSLDGYFDIIVKYIPSDVVGGWIVVKSAVDNASSEGVRLTAMWMLFGVFLGITAWWIWLQTREPGASGSKTQIIVSTVAFAVWVFALGSPFDSCPWYESWMGSVVLIIFTLVSGKIIPA